MASSLITTKGVNVLFDYLINKFRLKNDRELAQKLGVWPAAVSKARHGRMNIGSIWILVIHEEFELPIKDIKRMLNGQG